MNALCRNKQCADRATNPFDLLIESHRKAFVALWVHPLFLNIPKVDRGF